MNFYKNRPCSLQRRKHRRARDLLGPVGQEQGAWIANLRQPLFNHRKDADFVGPAKSIFGGAQDTILVAAFALERQYCVDHMFQHARPSDRTVLRNMANEHQCRTAFFGKTNEFLRRRTHLADCAGRSFNQVAVHRLNGIDDQ